jgi:hypothetical protein
MRSDALCAQGKQPTAMDFDIAARNGVCAAASWIIPRTCHRSRSVVIGPSVGSAEARTRERYHRSRAAEQRDQLAAFHSITSSARRKN